MHRTRLHLASECLIGVPPFLFTINYQPEAYQYLHSQDASEG